MKNLKQEISQLLLSKEAVKINLNELFRWSSGILSPIYCDNRKMLSFPKERSIIVEAFCKKISELNQKVNCIAGVATGGIAWGILVAEKLNLPFVYVRPEPKKHGLGNQIEGFLPQKSSVIVIEDLISTGASSLNACLALKNQNAHVQYLISIFEYGFSEAKMNFQKHQIPYSSLTDFHTFIQISDFSDEQKEWLINWIKNPSKTFS